MSKFGGSYKAGDGLNPNVVTGEGQVDAAATTETITLVSAPGAGKRLVVDDILVTLGDTGYVQLQDTAGTPVPLKPRIVFQEGDTKQYLDVTWVLPENVGVDAKFVLPAAAVANIYCGILLKYRTVGTSGL